MIRISRNKARYEKGQIFPFLIAVLVVVLIAIMVTVNLGQIGMFKIDTSNAADAAALAAASTLSGYLLGFGLRSDFMEAHMVATEVCVLIDFIAYPWPWCLVMAIITQVQGILANYQEYYYALSEGKMAWGQAKKTALQYAFQNAGVDEPRPTFRQFLSGVYGIGKEPGQRRIESVLPQEMAHYYEAYSIGDDRDRPELIGLIKQYTETGFSRFMEESRYWKWGNIEPKAGGFPARVITGYGWNDDGLANSRLKEGDAAYRDYDNWVEVEAVGNVFYPLDIYTPLANLIEMVTDFVNDKLEDAPWWIWFIPSVSSFVVLLLVGPIGEFVQKINFPSGLQMDIPANTKNNPIHVWVRRFKRSKNIGLWDFNYGTSQSYASGCAYGEKGTEDITPAFTGPIIAYIRQWVQDGDKPDVDDMYDRFDTRQHLFETEITHAW